ncbi:protein of unknown function [Methylocaldum szegediense]|uniref:Uncharacterized protein n=1 Tax=Methylocaldum szegediense TaxID=73780 RepID=A0ABN8X633_9GAMM|nr:protein of unknown function [Methylocaldum szegediense]
MEVGCGERSEPPFDLAQDRPFDFAQDRHRSSRDNRGLYDLEEAFYRPWFWIPAIPAGMTALWSDMSEVGRITA